MKTIAALIAILNATSAAAEPCVWGTNRPAIDVMTTNRIEPSAPQARCDMTVIERVMPDGRVQTTKTWNFSIGKR